jgi:hypothetical protein
LRKKPLNGLLSEYTHWRTASTAPSQGGTLVHPIGAVDCRYLLAGSGAK